MHILKLPNTRETSTVNLIDYFMLPRREIRLPCHLLIGSHVFCVEKLQLNEQKFELQQSLKAKYAFNIIWPTALTFANCHLPTASCPTTAPTSININQTTYPKDWFKVIHLAISNEPEYMHPQLWFYCGLTQNILILIRSNNIS